MPRCEGRPTEACPDRRNDSTVCLTQGDLMLCHACDEFRFPPTCGSRVSKTVRIVTLSNPKGYSASHGTASGITGETMSVNGKKTQQRSTVIGVTEGCGSDDEVTFKQIEQCMSCLKDITGNSLRVKCSVCTGVVHFSCTGIAEKSRRTFFEIFDRTGWMCNDCRMSAHTKFTKLQAEVGALREMVTELRQEVDELKAASRPTYCQPTSDNTVDNPLSLPPVTHGACSSTGDNVQSIVHKTLSDVDRRKRNVIVCGMPENESISDTESFQDICEQHLNCKPYIAYCFRLGQPTSNAIRRLLIRLRSDECAKELLRSAHLLRHAEHPEINSIYINPDLTPAAAKLAFEERQRRRAKAALQRNRVNNDSSDEAESLVQPNPDVVSAYSTDLDVHVPAATNAKADAATVTMSGINTNCDTPANPDQVGNSTDLLSTDCDDTSNITCGQKATC